MTHPLLAAVLFTLLLAAPAAAQDVQTLHYEFGPIEDQARARTRSSSRTTRSSRRSNGWITRFAPNLVRKDGSVPRVDVIHLHHGVWLKNLQPLFAAGEEKTTISAPPGYGWRYRTTDQWHMNHMIHNLTPTPEEVYITYDLDFVPDGTAAAAAMTEVADGLARHRRRRLPGVRRQARHRRARTTGPTYPDEVPGARRNGWVVPGGRRARRHAPGTCIRAGCGPTSRSRATGARRACSARARSTTSRRAPCRGTSSMTVTPPDWRVQLRKGDVLSISGTYDTAQGVVVRVDGDHARRCSTRAGPATTRSRSTSTSRAQVTHGHLPENDGHGGSRLTGLPDPRELLAGPVGGGGRVAIQGFVYGQGDLSSVGRARPARARAPRPRARRSSTATRGSEIFHTITACRAPCNRTTGIAYPLANGKVDFDSGELGFGPAGFTAAANRDTWRTPKGLKAGHLHVLLPRAPVHARGVQGQAEALTGRRSCSAATRERRPRRTSTAAFEEAGSVGVALPGPVEPVPPGRVSGCSA